MRTIFDDTTADETRRCTRSPRSLGWVMTQGKVKWRNDDIGIATITLTDSFTGKELFNGSIAGSGTEVGNESELLDIPSHYTLAISGVTGAVIIAAGIDGDSGDRGTVV